jgi:hypothetical protein
MVKQPVKKGRRGLRLPQKWMKYMIYLVGAIMVLSGLYVGLGREMPSAPKDDPTASWNIVTYDSMQVGASSAVTKIVGLTNQLKLRPKNMNLLQQSDITDIFESNITGVTAIVLETGAGENMFHFDTDGSNVSGEIRQRIRLRGDYILYQVYKGSTPYGTIDVVGENLKIGDYVRVFTLQRSAGARTETLGFVQKKLPEGPEVAATIVGLDKVGNSSASRLGYTSVPDEMVINGSVVSIPFNNNVRTTFIRDVKVNDTVRVRISLFGVGQEGVQANEILGSGTGPQ